MQPSYSLCAARNSISILGEKTQSDISINAVVPMVMGVVFWFDRYSTHTRVGALQVDSALTRQWDVYCLKNKTSTEKSSNNRLDSPGVVHTDAILKANFILITVADLGFLHMGGGAKSEWWGRQPIILANFLEKLHQNEKRWTGGKACIPDDTPFGSASG